MLTIILPSNAATFDALIAPLNLTARPYLKGKPGNLDALFDILSSDVPGPIRLVWTRDTFKPDLMTSDLAMRLNVFESILTELALERNDFKVITKLSG